MRKDEALKGKERVSASPRSIRRSSPILFGLRRLRILDAFSAVLLLAAAAALLSAWPRPVFLVEKEFVPAWELLLQRASGAPRWRIVEFDSEKDLGTGRVRRAILVTADKDGLAPPGADGGIPLPVVRWNLSRSRSLDGALALAADPWLVFRRHGTPPLTRDRLEAQGDGTGNLLLPGGEAEALWAWTAQELQINPGVFSRDPGKWVEGMRLLPRSGRFQPGTQTYRWEDVWPRLFGAETAWVYAPLSRIQAFPGDRTSALSADPFPIPQGWNEFGLQARVLWAVPLGIGKLDGKAAGALDWLRKPETQSLLAEILRWVPAVPDAKPATPLAHTAQNAWIDSSFVWEAQRYANSD